MSKDCQHSHAKCFDEVEALKRVAQIKTDSVEFPDAPPVQISSRIQGVSDSVAAFLPGPLSIRKIIQRERLQKMPTNPTVMAHLEKIPEEFRTTITGAMFLIYDSFDDRNYNLTCGRILIFSTIENLKRLMRSVTWYVDGTFKTAPSIFFQLFTILGSETQMHNGREHKFALPYVYALLESKQEVSGNFLCENYILHRKNCFRAHTTKFSKFYSKKSRSLTFYPKNRLL